VVVIISMALRCWRRGCDACILRASCRSEVLN
jgi:hypothetical protein